MSQGSNALSFKVVISVFAAILVLVVGCLFLCGPSTKAPHPVEVLPVSVEELKELNSYLVDRQFVGVVEATQRSNLGFERDGMVAEIFVKEGAVVEKGQKLAALDTARVEAQKNELQAQLQGAEAELSLAEMTLDRFEEAAASESISEQELDQATEAYNARLAAVDAREAGIERLDIELDKSVIYAPYEGTVIRRMVDSGVTVSAGYPILALQESTPNKVRVGLPGELAENYQIGDTVDLVVNEREMAARVTAILPVRDPRTRTIDVLLMPEEKVRSGDLVYLNYPVEVKEQGYWVPLTALTESIRGLWSVFVPVVKEDQTIIEMRLVELIHQEGEKVFVRGNLTPGEEVVTKGVFRLVPGQEVRVTDAPL